MRSPMYVLAILFFVVSSSSSSPAPDSSILFDIPMLNGITVDGSKEDWGPRGFIADFLYPHPENLPASHVCPDTVRIGWSEEGLLILVEMLDSTHCEDHDTNQLYRQDCVELFLSPKRGRAEIAQWVISPGMDARFPGVRYHFYDNRGALKGKNLPSAIAAKRAKNRNGYSLEAVVPWQALNIPPVKGTELALQVIVHDFSAANGRNTQNAVFGFYPRFDSWGNSMSMYAVRLADAASSFTKGYLLFPTGADTCRQLEVFAPSRLAGKTALIRCNGKQLVSCKLDPRDGIARGLVNACNTAFADTLLTVDAVVDGAVIDRLEIRDADAAFCIKKILDNRPYLVSTFSLDKPWDPLAGAPERVRRYRGMAAAALQWGEAYGVVDRYDTPEAPETVNIPVTAQMLRYAVSFIESLKTRKPFPNAKDRQFWQAYYSLVDGSGQHFATALPHSFDPKRKYALIVDLHGFGGRPSVADQTPSTKGTIRVSPLGRGDMGFTALGADDVMKVIEYMKQWYPIDEDRVYLKGWSMGGNGAWRIASRHPDVFAAAAVYLGWASDRWGDDFPIENLVNVPVFIQHGDQDRAVPVDACRAAVNRLASSGCTFVYKEYPGTGHDANPMVPVDEWLLSHRRNKKPAVVHYECQSPDNGKAYWLKVCSMIDPHVAAKVDARLVTQASTQILYLAADNVGALRCDIERMPVDNRRDLLIQDGTKSWTVKAPLPSVTYIVNRDDSIRLAQNWTEPQSAARPYRAGAAANLYDGEPLMVVYGTKGDSTRNAYLEKYGKRLARHGGAAFLVMAVGRMPAKADTAVTTDDLSRYNLLLLGGVSDNRLTERMAPKFPFTINARNELVAGSRKPVSLDGVDIRLAYYNPLAPQRLVFLLTLPREVEYLKHHIHEPPYLLTGMMFENRTTQPDLVVASAASAGKGLDCRRAMQFTHGWQWREVTGEDKRIDPSFAGRRSEVSAKILYRVTGADYALTKRDPGKVTYTLYDTAWYTLADEKTTVEPRSALLVTVPGADLVELIDNAATWDVALFPPPGRGAISREKTYSIALPPHLLWDLTTRKKAFGDVKTLHWNPAELWQEGFLWH